MSKRLRIYVDTSVIGGCLDEAFRETSVKLLALFISGDAVFLLSNLLLQELGPSPLEVQQVLDKLPIANVERLDISEEALRLQAYYLRESVVGPACGNDALHVALATVAQADVIVSWNFKHIVHLDKMRGFNAINLREGYPQLTILSPLEVV